MAKKHMETIKDILISHPKVVKIRYSSSTLEAIRSAWGKWERFCARPEVIEASGTCDPAIQCRTLKVNLVRAFLYWMCSQGTFNKLDSVLSHARHWRMAVKNETQCNVPDTISQDMYLFINSDLRGIFKLDELNRVKSAMNTNDFFDISIFNWTLCDDWYPTERDREQHWLTDLLCYATSARPGTIIEGGGYRHENESDSVKYKDIRLHLVKDPRNPTCKRLLMLIRFRLIKGYRNRGSPPWFVFYERPDTPSFCVVSFVLGLAFADQAFASPWIRKPEDIWDTEIPPFRKGIPLEWDRTWHETPLMRRAENINGVITTSRTKSAQYATYNAWNIRLGQSYGLENKFHFYCLRRGSGAAFNKNMTVPERMQVMGQKDPKVYDKHYLNEIIESDTLGILLGTPSNRPLMELASHMSLTRDPNAPKSLTEAQTQEVMAHPDLVNLKMRADAQKAALPGSGKRLRVARTEDPVGSAEYDRLRREYNSLRVSSLNEKYEQVRTDYFSTVGARYIDLQRRGCVVAEPQPPPKFEVPERAPLADLLFPHVSSDLKREDIVDWPSETHHSTLINLLATLCSRRCSPARKTKKDEEMVYIETVENGQTPDLYPIVCPSTLCLFCLGDTSLPPKDRMRHLSKPSNLKRHVEDQHLRHLEPGIEFCCPHRACSDHYLRNAMEFFNHAQIVHNVRH